MKLKRMIIGQGQKYCTNAERETLRETERQKRNNNGRAESKGTSWREVKHVAEQLLIRLGLNQKALPVSLGNPQCQTQDNSIMAPAVKGNRKFKEHGGQVD